MWIAMPGRYAPQPSFLVDKQTFSVGMEALLVGHEDWVFSVAWQPHHEEQHEDGVPPVPCLLSASMDRTMMLWRPETTSGTALSFCFPGFLKKPVFMAHVRNCAKTYAMSSSGSQQRLLAGLAGLWMCEESVGDAGASSLGYFGGCFSPDGCSIVAHGYTGALHLWRREGVSHCSSMAKVPFAS
jgi:elongator complex protein 2